MSERSSTRRTNRLLESIKTLLQGEDETGLIVTSYMQDIAMGKIADAKSWVKLGYNGDVDNTEEDLWSKGGTYTFPTKPMQMEVVSDNGNDTDGGTGIRKITVYYLNEHFEEKTEVVTLNGVSVVTTVATDILRVNAIRTYEVGSGLKAAGTIDIRHLNNTPIYRSIAAGHNRGRSLIYTVPINQTLYITGANLSAVTTSGGHYAVFTLRANYDDKYDKKVDFMEPYFEIALQDGSAHYPFDVPIKVPATCDLVMSVLGDAAAANTLCYGGLRGYRINT